MKRKFFTILGHTVPILQVWVLGLGLCLLAPRVVAQTLTFVGVTNGPNNTGGTQNTGVFVVGAAPSRVTYTFTNNTGAALPAGTLKMTLPTGGAYVAGSVSAPLTENNIVNPNMPIFNTPIVANGGTFTVSYQTRFGCAVIGFLNGGGLARDVGSFNGGASMTPAATYNIASAALTITGVTNSAPTVNVGDMFTQTVTIRNGGLNSIVPGTVTLNLGTLGGVSVSMASLGTLSGNSISFAPADINGTNLINDDGDNQWESGEDLQVSYQVVVNSCSNLSRSLTASWGDGVGTCQTSAGFPVGVNIANTVPNLAAVMTAAPLSPCQIDMPRNITVTVTNNGTGPASNIQVELLNHAFNAFTSGTPTIIDIASIVVNLPSGGTYSPGLANTTVLGTIGNNAVNVPSNGCAIGQPGHVRFSLPAGIVLPPTQNFTVTYQVRYCDNNTCTGGYNPADQGTIVRYQSQCADASFATPISGNIAGPRVMTSSFVVESPAQVLNGQCITVKMDGTFIVNLGGTNDHLELSVALPPGFSYNPGTLVSPLGYTLVAGYPQVSGGRLLVRYADPALSGAERAFALRFGLCVNQSPCVGGTVNLDPKMQIIGDNTCVTPFGAQRCRTANIQVLCACCPEGGLSPVSFNFRRTTLGLQDNDADGFPDPGSLPADPNFANLDRYRPGDELTATAEGVILGGNTYTNWNHVYANWSIAAGGGNWEPVGSATITIVDASTGVTHTAAGVPVTGSAPGTSFAANWDAAIFVPALPVGFVYQPGDVVRTEAVFRLTSTVSTNNQTVFNTTLNATTPANGVFSQGFYATQAANPPVNPAPINVGCPTDPTLSQGPNRYQCSPINYGYAIAGMNSDMFFDGPKVFNSACGAIETNFRFQSSVQGSQGGGQFFPFEYRPTVLPGVYTLTLPVGFEYVPGGSANADIARLVRTISSGNSVVENAPMIPTVSGSPVTGQVLTYNLASVFTVNGGPLVLSTEGYSLRTFLALRPTCAAQDAGVWTLRQTDGTFLTWPNTANPNKINLFLNSAGQTGANQPFQYTNTVKPSLTLSSATPTVSTPTNKATWTLILNNTTNNAAPNSFISFTNLGMFSNLTLMEGVTPISDGNGDGIYELGTTAGAASRTFTLMATLGKCDLDNLTITYGWDCGAYPTSLGSYPDACEKTLVLGAQALPAGLDATFDFIPNNPNPALTGIDLCAPVSFDAVINSTLSGILPQLTYKVTLPTGMTYLPGSVRYAFPAGGALGATAYNPTVVGNMLVFDVDAMLGAGLSGVGDINRNVRIRFDVTTNCSFTSGSSTEAAISGVSDCGAPVPATGLPLIKRSSEIKVNGLIQPYLASVAATPNDITLLGCTQTAVINISVGLTGGQTALAQQDKTIVRLPAGMVLVNWACTTAPQCPNAPTTAVDGMTGETVLEFTYPAGIPTVANAVIGLQLTVRVGSGTTCSPALSYKVFHTFLSNALSCGAGFCPPSPAIGASDLDGVINVSKAQVALLPGTSACVAPNGSVVLNGTLSVSALALSAGENVTADFYCADAGGLPVGGVKISYVLSGPAAVGSQHPFSVTVPAGCANANGIAYQVSGCMCGNLQGVLPTTVDVMPPILACPPNQSVGTAPACSAALTYNKPTATDNCAIAAGQPVWVSGGSGTVVGVSTVTATFPLGITTVVWKATDAVGNMKTCSFRVIVSDTQAPVITCPTIPSVDAAPGTCSAVVTYANATATDNCSANPVVTRIKGFASGSTFAVGSTRLIFRATDAAGRTSTCSVSVVVVDNQPPMILCPGNITATGNGIPCRAVVNYAPTTATDNCDGTLSPFLVSGLASGSVFPAGVTTNTWRAVASNGQQTTCAFTVTVNNCPALIGGGVELRGNDAFGALVELRVAPSPADERALAVVDGLDDLGGRLQMFDVAGRLVWEQNLRPVKEQQQVELPVGTLQQGVYQVVLRAPDRVVTKPLVVVHH